LELLRPGLLEGVSVVLAGADPHGPAAGATAAALRTAFTELGAHVHWGQLFADGEPAPEDRVDRDVAAALAESEQIEMLAVDGGGLFTARGGGRDGLRLCLEATWNVTRAVANAALIPSTRGGRIAYIAPAPAAGEHARACCAGLENLARTLSIEWARYSITPVTIAAGEDTEPGELAAITAYLASPAGAYFSGCLLDLRGPGGACAT
jgi:NAD(P)-dependent dehydrogenase (short-subunit alcohol dehydrogenase family)